MVDDFGVVRDGLKLLLDAQPDIEVVGEAACIEEAVARVGELQPDVVLLDLMMAERVTSDRIPALRAAAAGASVLVVSPVHDPCHVRDSFAAGAAGYVLKEAAATKLLDAVREAASGSPYLDPELGARLALAEVRDPEVKASSVRLREREQEVLRLVSLGHTCSEIAAMLNRSPRTIELYRSRIMEKLGLETRADLVRYALEHRLLEGADHDWVGAEATSEPAP